jgi:hypothetical protein
VNQSVRQSLYEQSKPNSCKQAPEELADEKKGHTSDLELLIVLEEAILHPNLEIIQIAECLHDFAAASQYQHRRLEATQHGKGKRARRGRQRAKEMDKEE